MLPAVAGLLAAPLSTGRAAPVEVQVTIESLAPDNGTLVTPVWVGFHDGSFDYFNAGEPAPAALESLAEDGDSSALDTAFAVSGAGMASGVIVSSGAIPPFAPGQMASKRFTVDSASPRSRYLSYAAMVIPSNDAFIGNDDPLSIPVFDDAGRFLGGSFIVAGTEVWDAGSEVNDELPMNTAFLGQAVPNNGDSEGGVIGIHTGFMAAGAGGILDGSFAGFTFTEADFKKPEYSVVRITITRVVPVTVTVENLAPTDGTLLTPVWVGFHDGMFDIFNRGVAAGTELERLAEDGNSGPLAAAFEAASHGGAQATIESGGAIPPFAPGQRASHTFWLDPDAPQNRYFSYAAMVIPSNDAFIVNEDLRRHPVFDATGRFVGGRFTVTGWQVWDAGTEVNDEAAMNTAFLGQESPDTGATEGGTPTPHAGFKPAGMGGILDGSFAGFSFAGADFTVAGYAVARITLSVPQEVTVTVENLAPTNGTHITPTWIGFHDGSFDLFDDGVEAGATLERLAEDGDARPLSAAFEDNPAGVVQGTIASGGALPPLAPGQRARMTFLLDPLAPSSRFLSYAAMVIPSNDAFIGNDDPAAIRIFDDAGSFLGAQVKVTGDMVRDAGTEVNDEIPAHTAFLGQATPDTGLSEGGTVGPHPGFKPVGSGGILDGLFAGFTFGAADFTTPDYAVARITVSRSRPVNLLVENLSPALGTYLTPFWVGFHDGSFDLFDANIAASTTLERLAEDGMTGPLEEVFKAGDAGTMQTTVTSGRSIPVFAPGQGTTQTFWLDPLAAGSRFLSYAAMVIPSNDAFIGNDDPTEMPVFDGDGSFVGGSMVVPGSAVWDAGTEVNDELPMNTPLLGQTSLDTGQSEGSMVMPHGGFKPTGSGGILDVAMFGRADFTDPGYQVARLTLEDGPIITLLQLREGLARLTWAGGEGPFTIQARPSLITGAWKEVLTTTESLADLPVEGAMGFFRVVGR